MIALWLAAACTVPGLPGAAPPAEEPVVAEAADPLADDAYRFCHVDGADAEQARAFCDLIDAMPADRCPGLRATCAGATAERDLDPFGGGCGGWGAPTAAPAPPPTPPAPPPALPEVGCDGCTMPSCDAPTTAAGMAAAILQWFTAILVALFVLFVVRLMVRFIGRRRDVEDAPAVVTSAAVSAPTADEVPDRPPDDLLGAAARAYDAGRWADAVLLARGAALRALGDAGRVKLHRSRTDREYLRSVRSDPDLAAPLGDVLGAVEEHRWGGRPVGRDRAAGVLASVRRLLSAAGVVVALLLVVGADGNAERYGSHGDAALLAVFAEQGFEASWRLRGLSSLGDDVDVLVLDLSGIAPSASDWAAVREWVAAGGVLLAAGAVHEGFPELGRIAPLPPGTAVRWAPGVFGWLSVPRFPGGPAVGWSEPQGQVWIEAGGASSQNGARVPGAAGVPVAPRVAVVQRLAWGSGGVIAIADPVLLYNGSLVVDANVDFLGSCVWYGESTGAFLLPRPVRLQLATLSSAGAESPVGSLRNARLLPFVVQLLVLVGLAALWKGWPFGPLRDPPEEGRLRFAEHVTALGHRYARLRASRHALSAVARLWLTRLGPHGLEQAAIQAGRTPEEARRFVQRLQAVLEDDRGGYDRADLDLMEELWRSSSPR